MLRYQERFYIGAGRGTCPPDSLAPQIQKLADRSGMISEVPKCSKIQIFRGSAPDPAGGASPEPQVDGKRTRCHPSKNPNPLSALQA